MKLPECVEHFHVDTPSKSERPSCTVGREIEVGRCTRLRTFADSIGRNHSNDISGTPGPIGVKFECEVTEDYFDQLSKA